MKQLFTKYLGKLNGKRIHNYACKITFNERASLGFDGFIGKTQEIKVISDTPSNAADYLMERLSGVPCVELTVYGPRGGNACERFQGWESAVWSQMQATHDSYVKQLELF
tara:strand:+ start:562 stop:891 length:330 start_codon:yes stop_codon:yes gene_type:complete